MYKGKTILGLIPARGGSKGIPRKNIKPLLGKPLIAWTIEQALISNYLDVIVVSTDDKEIAEISKKYGAWIPFMRPKELARDDSTSIDVVIHTLNWFENVGMEYDYVALLEPTCPLRETSDIDKSVELLIDNKIAESIVGVTRLEGKHPEFNIVIDKKSGFIRKANGTKEFKVLRRQDLSDIYHYDGTIYISKVSALKAKKIFYHELTMAYIVPNWRSLGIDELADFICVEALLKYKLEGGK